MKENTNLIINDVTDIWKAQAKPKEGEIELSEYTIAKSGNKYDENNASFGVIQEEEKDIGTWFKNTIWGDVKIQRGLMWPEHERSADLLILNNCQLLDEQTIEMKTIDKTKSIKGVNRRLRSGKGQSENILFDITKSSMDEANIVKQAKRFLNKNDWLKILIIKNNSKYYVYKK